MDTPLLTTPQNKFAKENATDIFRNILSQVAFAS